MVLFNYATKEITAKVVYYGPGLCGKTTNLQFVYDSLPSNSKNKMLSLATKTDRTLFFDFLPLDLGRIRGMSTRLQLYTVPGQVYYNETRQLVLKGADGVVFVADSQDYAMDANLESLQNLEDNLKRMRIRLSELPLVFQYNKRDLPNALPVARLEAEINKLGAPSFESVATTGIGVEQTLRGITRLVLKDLIQKYGEGDGALDRDLQILNPSAAPAPAATGGDVWSDEETAQGPTTPPVPTMPTQLVSEPPPPAEEPPPPPSQPASPFGDVFGAFEDVPEAEDAEEISLESVEMPLPPAAAAPRNPTSPGTTPTPPPASPAPQRPPTRETPLPPSAGATASAEPLVREITIPLNLTADELRRHRRLRLKIQLDVNILP